MAEGRLSGAMICLPSGCLSMCFNLGFCETTVVIEGTAPEPWFRRRATIAVAGGRSPLPPRRGPGGQDAVRECCGPTLNDPADRSWGQLPRARMLRQQRRRRRRSSGARCQGAAHEPKPVRPHNRVIRRDRSISSSTSHHRNSKLVGGRRASKLSPTRHKRPRVSPAEQSYSPANPSATATVPTC